MEILIVGGLVALGLVLLLIEVFVIPGFSLAGMGAIGSMIAACIYAFTNMGVLAGIITTVAVLILSVLVLIWFMRSRTLDKLSLKAEIRDGVDNSAERSIVVGQKGITTTRLALIGMADFDGTTAEVKSIDGFLDEQTPIVVSRITDGTLLVKKQ